MGTKKNRKLRSDRSIHFKYGEYKYVVDIHTNSWYEDGSSISVYKSKNVTWTAISVDPNIRRAIDIWFVSDMDISLQDFIDKMQP